MALAEVGGGGDGNPLKCPTHFTKSQVYGVYFVICERRTKYNDKLALI